MKYSIDGKPVPRKEWVRNKLKPAVEEPVIEKVEESIPEPIKEVTDGSEMGQVPEGE